MALVDERAMLEEKTDLTETPSVNSEVTDKTEEKTDELFIEDHDSEVVRDTKASDDDEEEDKNEDDADGNKIEEEDDNEVEEKIPETLYQTLKARDPKLLKEIPELRTAIFREQKFSEIYPTIEEAEEAKEVSELFAQYQQDLLEGNSKPILDTLQKTDKNALELYATSFLSSLEEVDEKLYRKTIFPQFKKLFQIAKQSGRKEYMIAAENLNHMIWNNTDIDKDEGLAKAEPKKEDDKLTARERAFEERIYNTFANDLNSTTEARLTKSIKSVFAKSNISDLIQNSLTREVLKKIGTALANDKRHMSEIDLLWKKAKREGYTAESKDRITNAYLSRANLLVPKIRQTVLTEAKISVRTPGNETKKQEPVRISAGAAINSKSGKVDYKNVDWSKTKEDDFIKGQNIVLKK